MVSRMVLYKHNEGCNKVSQTRELVAAEEV